MSAAIASAATPQVPLAPPPSEPDASPKSTFQTRTSPSQAERSMVSAPPRTSSPNAPIIVSEGTAKQKLTPENKRSPMLLV